MTQFSPLPPPSDRAALVPEWFPAPFQAVIWRNWGQVPRRQLAAALHASIAELDAAAADLGLVPDDSQCRLWLSRGYVTLIRQNWHLLDWPELLLLLDWTPEKLWRTILEADQFWKKMDCFKPRVSSPRIRPLTADEQRRTAEIRELFADDKLNPEPPFAFLNHPATGLKPAAAVLPGERLVYPYALPFNAAFDDDLENFFPEGDLEVYAACGVTGLWLPAVLYDLIPWLGENFPLSAHWREHLPALRRLGERLRRYGLKLFLYLNEPRSLPEELFSYLPESWRGVALPWMGVRSICSSSPEAASALEAGVCRLFREVPELGGLFTITRSENPTNCFSHYSPDNPPDCPRCRQLGAPAVISGVIRALFNGARAGNPGAAVYVWNWAWKEPWDAEIIRALPAGVKLLSSSEDRLPTSVGGIAGEVRDYSISKVGPGPTFRRYRQLAAENGLELGAKLQLNNSWELANIPYLPVPGLVAEHLRRMREMGVRDWIVSWSMGGFAGGNLALMNTTAEEFAAGFGPAAGAVSAACRHFEDGFRHFPFHQNSMLYLGPHNLGPGAPLFPVATGYRATMVGFPYDDLTSWRGIYPEEVFEAEYGELCREWRAGLELLRTAEKLVPADRCDLFAELQRMAEAGYCHFRSAALHSEFVRRRDAGERVELLPLLREEEQLARKLLALVCQDSRLGFESSNQYSYTPRSLQEMILNRRYLQRLFAGGR